VRLRLRFLVLATCISASFPILAAEDNAEAGKKELAQSCQPCHSLRLVESQRLSTAAWQKEVDKMIGWGAVVPDRQLVVNYLSEHYSNLVPQPAPVMSSAKSK
jgi:mono/diheme cytochrome c family protein